ncbi:MAG: GNAT family N-acetyltransferase, partial [Phycisphaerae bacterium]|nr:GNAT family N-acetyltransferase [Phycisphaerae bacterium]
MKKIEITTERREDGWRRRLLVGGKAASSVSIVDHTIRIGTSRFRMGGIGSVKTDSRHRLKGHMRKLMEDSVRFMQDRGYVFSMLFGIENFYHKFGYEVSLPEYRMTMQTRDAERAGNLAGCSGYRVRRARVGEFPTICRIHN